MKPTATKIILSSLLLLFTVHADGQRQAYNWHFADGVSVSFNNGTPQLLPASSMFTQEGCSVQNDQEGNLLFYTNGGGRQTSNGGTIWNRNHEEMYNMQGIEGGGFSARQSAISFPVPNSEQRYYLFTMEENEFDLGGSLPDQPQGRGLSYFIINMELNNGLGGIEVADERVYVPMYEGLTAVKMQERAGYWVIGHTNATQLVVVSVTAEGVGTPQIYPIEGQGSLEGAIKASPNGEMLYCNQRLIKFSPSTGMPLAEESIFLQNASGLSAEFTANSRYLYTTATGGIGRRLLRYDLENDDIINSAALLYLFQEAGFTYQMQLAPNGNIYLLEESSDDNRKGLSEISCPASNEANLSRYIIDLSEQLFLVGLPNFPADIFAPLATSGDTIRMATDSLEICAGDPVIFNTVNSGTAYLWSDGSTDNLLFTNVPGDYSVTITGGCDPIVEYFYLSNTPPLEAEIQILSDTSRLCAVLDSVTVTYYSNQTPTSLFWSTSVIDEDSFIVDTFRTSVNNGANQIRLSLRSTCETVYDTLLFNSTTYAADLITDFNSPLCPEDELLLSIQGTNVEAVLWEDSSIDFERIVTSADSNIIYYADVFSVCGDSTRLYSSLDYTQCPIVCDAMIPDLISPNNDRTNDEFKVFTNCDLEDFSMIIFNRWGQTVYQTTDQTAHWDGTINGTPQPMDTYIYRIVYRFPDNPEYFKKDGKLVLVR